MPGKAGIGVRIGLRAMLQMAPVLGAMAFSAAATGTHAQPVARDVADGRNIYVQFCASCHGARGEGAAAWQNPDQNGEMPAPPHDAEGHTWKHSDAMLFQIVQQGWRDPFNKTQRLTMPAFKGQLSPRQTITVITYLKSLWKPQQQQFQAEESRGHPFPDASP